MTEHCRNLHIHGQEKIAFSYLDPGGTLKKIKQPKSLFRRNEEVYVSKEVKENALDSHQRANHARLVRVPFFFVRSLDIPRPPR